MNKLLRESASGLVLCLLRGLIATVVAVALFRRSKPEEPVSRSPVSTAAEKPLRVKADPDVLHLRAVDVERMARQAAGWPDD